MLNSNSGLAIALTCLFLLAGCSSHDTTPHSTQKPQISGPRTRMHTVPPDARAYEKDFLHRMSDHHASDIAISNLAEQRAMHPELKAMAAASATEQQSEVTTMQDWLSKWYFRDVDPHVTEDIKPVLERLSTLPPEQFDRVFLREMIKHHQAGIAMAQPMVEQAPHPEVQAMAKQIIAEQSKESSDMSDRLRQWYGEGAPAGMK